MFSIIQSADRAISLFFQESVRCGILDPIMTVITKCGNSGICWVILGIILLCIKKTRKEGFQLLITLGLCWCINDGIIKNVVARPRPFAVIPELTTLVPFPTSNSFPSGHACSSFAAAYYLTKAFGKNGAWAYIPAALIAVSRVYVGVHYMTDIICGAIVGTVGALLLFKASLRLRKNLNKTQ